jgi:alpha-1,2-mannosyltransferase
MSVNHGERTVTRNPLDAQSRAAMRLSPGAVIIAATIVALGVRLYTLTRPGFLTQSTEYDDGVYLGAAIRMTQGVMPYHDFAFVQPPGILLLMTPAALFARVTSTGDGMALARVLTVLASTACIPLAGWLVRYRGTLVTALTCFILALYPSDIAAAHTLLLEPWMNLLCLAGANLAFSGGQLADRTSRLAWAGIVIGFAGTVKFWAAAPAIVILVICLLSRDQARIRRTVAYLAGAIGAFLVPLLPFVTYGPMTFLRSTIVYQAGRVGSYTPLSLRLAHITGLIDLLNYWGTLTLTAGSQSLYAQAVDADTAPAHPSFVPYLAAALVVAVIGVGFYLGRGGITHVEWFALVTAVLAIAAILWYSAFFYHYPAFPGPWLAIIAGVAIGALIARIPIQPRLLVTGAVAVGLAAAAVLQIAEVTPLRTQAGTAAFVKLIPPGACVVSDQVSLLIAADRFNASKPGCPVVIDSLATTLVLAKGTSIQGGANNDRTAVAQWKSILERAQYVWLSPNNWRRLPWPSYEKRWFRAHYKQIWPVTHKPFPNTSWVPGLGNLFERIS